MKLPLVHHPDYDADTVPDGHRFPMRKYSRLASLIAAARIDADWHRPDEAPAPWLRLAHSPAYVQAVLTGTLDRASARRIGFDPTAAIIRRSRLAVAGTCLAAGLALERGLAVNLAGGSHHAGPDGGAGFCVFNDVGVAAHVLLSSERVARLAVIDLDVHHGDGTAQILSGVAGAFTFSMHAQNNWPRNKPASDMDIGLPDGTGDAAYLAALEPALDAVLARAQPELVFYNGGVDPHGDDRLGRLALSDAGLAARDLMVVGACRRRGVPVCGVLGGGYSRDPDAVARRHLFLVRALAA